MPRECACGCGRSLEGRPAKTRFVDAKHRKLGYKVRHGLAAAPATVSALPKVPGSTVSRVQDELEAADRADSYLGAAALALAERIDNATAVMGFAALVRELRLTMDAAMEGVGHDVDALTDIRSSAALKLIQPA